MITERQLMETICILRFSPESYIMCSKWHIQTVLRMSKPYLKEVTDNVVGYRSKKRDEKN